jgi:hypothetical protein
LFTAAVLIQGVATLLRVAKLLKWVAKYQNIEFFDLMSLKEAILTGILHQSRLQDAFRVARFLSTSLGVASKKI